MNAKSLISKFVNGPVAGKASALSTEGDTARSYHVTVAKVDRDARLALVLEAGAYSVTTSKHCNALATALKEGGFQVTRVSKGSL